jgi:hypothetical protein
MCEKLKFEAERFRAVAAFPPGGTPRLYRRRGRPPLQQKGIFVKRTQFSGKRRLCKGRRRQKRTKPEWGEHPMAGSIMRHYSRILMKDPDILQDERPRAAMDRIRPRRLSHYLAWEKP